MLCQSFEYRQDFITQGDFPTHLWQGFSHFQYFKCRTESCSIFTGLKGLGNNPSYFRGKRQDKFLSHLY